MMKHALAFVMLLCLSLGWANSKAVAAVQCPLIDNYGGNGNGSTSNNAAFASALAANLYSDKLCVAFGAGNYYFSSNVSVSLPSGGSLALIGNGSGVTKVSASSGVTLFSINWTNQTASLHVSGMSVLTGGTGGSASGFYLTITSPSTSPGFAAPSTFSDVVFRGSDGFNATDAWGYAINVQDVSNITFTNVNIYGSSPASNYGVYLQGATSGSTQYPGVLYNFTDCNFTTLSYGIYLVTQIQGVTVSQSNFTGDGFAIYVPTGLANGYQLAINNSQFGFSPIFIYSPSFAGVFLTSNMFATGPGQSAIFYYSSYTSITGNNFYSSSTSSSYGVNCEGPNTNVTGNTFFQYYVGVILQPSSSYAYVQGNNYQSVTTKVYNTGTANSVGVATQ